MTTSAKSLPETAERQQSKTKSWANESNDRSSFGSLQVNFTMFHTAAETKKSKL